MSWVSELCSRLRSLEGARVETAVVVEMAIADRGPDGQPVFRSKAFPFVQCRLIELRLADGRFALFHSYQNNDTFGVIVDFSPSTLIEAHWNDPLREGEASIFRVPSDLNFPIGRVENVVVGFDRKGDVTELALSIAEHRVLLKAGEVYEDDEGRFIVSEMDESILLFLDTDDASRVAFNAEGESVQIVAAHKGQAR